MKSNRWTGPGPWVAQDLGMGTWRLLGGAAGALGSADVSAPIEILIRGAGPDAAECFEDPITRLTVEWGPGTPVVSVTRSGAARVLSARCVIVHEPRPLLYQALPLAKFDADARRFWGRIFRVMRLPGGRWLVKLVARRRRR
jgi:hypothetical protein